MAIPPYVCPVDPVPPLAIASVPAKVTAPLVADAGVSPVVPPLNVVTALLAIVAVVTKVLEAGIVVLLIVPAVVFPVMVGVAIVGEVERTTFPEPVEPVRVGDSGFVPSPVEVTNRGVVVVLAVK